MNKIMKIMAVVAVLVMLICGTVLAEEVAESCPDFSDMVISFSVFIRSAVACLFGWVFYKYIKPFLKDKGLMEAAKIAVKAAETIIGRKNGEKKLFMALNYMKEKGFNINVDKVKESVLAAWFDLNITQILAGEKQASGESDDSI